MRRSHYDTDWVIDEIKHPADRSAYPTRALVLVPDKMTAMDIKSALNHAFSDGVEYGRKQQEDEVKLDEMHQGFSNYETFIISQWIDNDEFLLGYVKDGYYMFRYDRPSDEYMGAFAQWLRDYAEEMAGQWIRSKKDCFVGSLVNNALSSVDWLELAKHYSEGELQIMSKSIRVDPLNLEGFMEDLNISRNARRAKRALAAHRRSRRVREPMTAEQVETAQNMASMPIRMIRSQNGL